MTLIGLQIRSNLNDFFQQENLQNHHRDCQIALIFRLHLILVGLNNLSGCDAANTVGSEEESPIYHFHCNFIGLQIWFHMNFPPPMLQSYVHPLISSRALINQDDSKKVFFTGAGLFRNNQLTSFWHHNSSRGFKGLGHDSVGNQWDLVGSAWATS